MRAIKVWVLDRNGLPSPRAVPTTPVEHTETERLLEDVLVSSPELLFGGIELVGRQNQTTGGPLDLLGIDDDGVLVVFELKRGKLTRDAVAQVIDYASYLRELSRQHLAEHIETRSGTGGIQKIDDFESWYQERFGSDSEGLQQRPRMVLVGLGVDDTTRRMVEFLSAGGLDVSLITFHAFAQNGQTFLARQIEVLSQEPPQVKSAGYTKEENLVALTAATKELGCGELFEKIRGDVAAKLEAYGWPSRTTYTFSLPERTESGTLSQRAYVSLYFTKSRPGSVGLGFHRRAIDAAGSTWQSFIDANGDRADAYWAGQGFFYSSFDDWEHHWPAIDDLLQAILTGWKSKKDKQEELIQSVQ